MIPLALALAASTGFAEPSATIYRDRFGVPHVLADTAEALFYAGGYALAQDRLAEFERSRRAALGRRAELEPRFLDADRHSRLVALTEHETRAMFESLSPSHQRIVKAIVAGINRAIDEALAEPRAKMPYEFGVLWQVKPERWTIHDYIATYAAHRQSLIAGSGRELENLKFYRYLVERYGEAQARDIFDDVLPLDDPDAIPTNPSRGPFPESLAGTVVESTPARPSAGAPPRPFAQLGFLGVGSEIAAAASFPPPAPHESRSVVIGPSRSASGNVMMMQATSDGPQIRYLGAGFDAYGYTRQGGGPLVMGRGPAFGWLQNVGMDDQIDVFAERIDPKDRYRYRFDGQWRDMERRTEVLRVRGGEPQTVEIAKTVHGPVIAWDVENERAYTLQNALRGAEMNDWACNLEWARARTLAEFERSVPLCSATTTINFGGEDGTIAHWHAARRPIRPGGIDPRLPAPGTGEHEWQGFVPFREWSKFKNPAEGYFHAWNNRTTPAIPFGDTFRWGATFRNYLAHDLLAGREKLTFQEFRELNRNLGSGWGGTDLTIAGPKFFVPYLRPAVAGDERLAKAVEVMAGWNAILLDEDGDGLYDDPGATLLLRFLDRARETIVRSAIGEWEPWIDDSYRTAVLLRAIQGADAGQPMRFDWFLGKQRSAVLRQIVTRVVEELSKEFGSEDMAAWKTPIYWRYYDADPLGRHPDKPSRRSYAHPDQFSGWSGTTAARLGITPFAIPDNGSEQWNGLMEISAREKIVYDGSPLGGQNQFINLAGEANPNIGDQLLLHATFELKKVPMSLAELRAEARSVVTLKVPDFATE
jgi:acyl-homoserine lactone acylase PvdQ